MRHDRKFNKWRKGLGSPVRSPFSFWNSLTVQYFCLTHPHTSRSSHIALIIAASQHAPAKHQTFLVSTLCCPSPLLFLSGRLSTLHRNFGMFWVCFQGRSSWRSAGTLKHVPGWRLQLRCQRSHSPACSRHSWTSFPNPHHAPLGLQYGLAGQMIQTSHFGLWAVLLRPLNATRRSRTFSEVSRIKGRAELWCPCRHLSWWRLFLCWYPHTWTCTGTAVSRQVIILMMSSITRAHWHNTVITEDG